MKKYIVETYYTCTFKTVHSLDVLNDKELSKVDKRTDGSVEVIDVKLNNRKTKKLGEKNSQKNSELKTAKNIPNKISDKLFKENKDKLVSSNPIIKNKARFKMPDRKKVTFKRLRLVIIKYIYTLENMMMGKSVRYLLIQIKRVN